MFTFHPEHPRTNYMGAEADDWPSLRFNENNRTGGKILNKKQALYYITTLFHNTGRDNMNVFIQRLHLSHIAPLQCGISLGHR